VFSAGTQGLLPANKFNRSFLVANSPKHSKYASAGYRALRWLGLWALTVTAHASVTPDGLSTLEDQRHAKLETFFLSFGCPVPFHVKEYLGTADTYAIDYRLLPAISVLESTCGIYQRENNRWGWASARMGFSSFRAGLEFIARQLTDGRYYKNKTLEEKVRMYNPRPQYARQLERLMLKIDAALPSLAADTHYAGGEEFRPE
jgi:hypothetical protein